MTSLKDTIYYGEAIQELNYPFGNFYLFDAFVVSEIKKDIVFNWKEHGKQVADEISQLYGDNGKNIVYISNRIHKYSVIPSDWLKFFKFSYALKGYAVVGNTKNSILEKLFFKCSFKNFDHLGNAIRWAKSLSRGNECQKRLSA